MISWYIWPLAKNVPFLGMKQKKNQGNKGESNYHWSPPFKLLHMHLCDLHPEALMLFAMQ
jgi:hypothetical protein